MNVPRERTGHFEGIDNFNARGWAIDPKLWPKPLQIELLVEDMIVARGFCDQARPDLAAIGLPSKTGFSIGLPRFLMPDTLAALVVRFADTKELLEGSARRDTSCPSASSFSFEDKIALAKALLTSIYGESAFLAAAPRKIAIYAIYNDLATPSKTHLATLRELRENGYSTIVVNDVPVANDRLVAALASSADLIIHRRPGGRDFGSWFAAALVYWPHLSRASEIFFVNDSVIGPVKPLAHALERRDRNETPDFWGLSDSYQIAYHVQSSLFSITGALFGSDVFRGCLAQYSFPNERDKVILFGELGLTDHMLAGGVRPSVLCPYDELAANWLAKTDEWKNRIARDPRGFRRPGEREFPSIKNSEEVERQLKWIDAIADAVLHRSLLNPQHFFWDEMIERYDYPYLKRELFIDNPERIPTINYLDQVIRPRDFIRTMELIDDELSRRLTVVKGNIAR